MKRCSFAIAILGVILFLGLATPAASQSTQTSGMSETGVLLEGRSAKSALDQCTREAPDTGSALWIPSSREIARLEGAINHLLQTMLDSARRALRDTSLQVSPTDYYRQYVGVVVGGRRLIYVNGFHRQWFDVWSNAIRLTSRDTSSKVSTVAFDWRRRPVK